MPEQIKRALPESSVTRLLATSAPKWLTPFAMRKAKAKETPVVGEALPNLFRLGFPHLRFADGKSKDAEGEARG